MGDLIRTITVSDYVSADIPIFIDYWHDTSTTHIREMGVDQGRLPTRQAMREALSIAFDRRQNSPVRAASRIVAICASGRTIGFHQVTDLETSNRSAVMHGYITHPSWRGRGVGTVSYTKSMQLFFDRFDLNSIVFETPNNNFAAQAVKRKLGILPCGEIVICKPFLIRPLPATRYLVTKDDLETIVRNMHSACASVGPEV